MKIIFHLFVGCVIAALIVLSVQAGSSGGPSSSPLNTSYRIENKTVQPVNGQTEVQAAPGSAINMNHTGRG